ncbi:MAG: glycoside hydrolase family 2 TIM barrel-domain containing protein, partial [Gemmataceae bacterium]
GRGRRTPGWIWKKVQAGEKLAADRDDAIEDHSISLENPRLWSPESPFLHDVTVTLTDGDKTIDSVQTYFGMRKTSLGKDDKGVTRLFLNNKPYFQVGLLDQGFWPDGIYTAPTDAALRYDIEFTRKLGFNVARKHVKVEPARWYHWCDKLGLLVWQDMPSGDASVGPGQGEIKRGPDAARQFERELSRMIESLAAFPSIVMWVPFNEGWGQYDTPRIVDLVRKLDPTRLVNNASGWNDMKCGDVHDFHVYPGPGSPRPEENRAAVLGEFGGLGLSTPGHMWTKEFWGYRGVRDKADLTSKYVKLLQGVYRLKENPGLSACIYTQTTDVETEANGLITYDRAVIKVDVDRVAAANRGDFTGVVTPTTLVATSQDVGKSWRYTLDQPPARWNQPDFKDDDWKQGKGGFGTPGTPGGAIRTTWKTPTIWMRREFTLDRLPKGEILAIMHHDEDAEVFINGVPALDVKGFTTDYEEFPIDARAAKSLRVGKNLISVRCRQTGGGQYIDVGLAEIPPRSK